MIQSVFCEYNGMKLEIKNRAITGKSPNHWKLNIPLKYIQAKSISQGKFKIVFK